MLQDLRFGVRLLRRQAGFSLVAVLTLALGIGSTSAVFSLIRGVLLTPPPYRDPQRLVLLPAARTDGRTAGPRGWPAAQWQEWRSEAHSIESLAAYSWSFNFLVLDQGSESLELSDGRSDRQEAVDGRTQGTVVRDRWNREQRSHRRSDEGA